MEPLNFHFLAILGKKGTFGTQWQSLINSQTKTRQKQRKDKHKEKAEK